jgi:hypothetical protein
MRKLFILRNLGPLLASPKESGGDTPFYEKLNQVFGEHTWTGPRESW